MKLLLLAVATSAASAAEPPYYIGCFHDENWATVRDLPHFYCSNGPATPAAGNCNDDPSTPTGSGWAGHSAMTPSLCSTLCAGFKFFGTQAGSQCLCGNDYGNQGGKAPDSDCNTPCTGDSSSTMCGAPAGAPARNSIYAQPQVLQV